MDGVDVLVANTDAQALNASPAERRSSLAQDYGGSGSGLAARHRPAAAEETIDQVQKALEGVHMCFIAAGMGGGTGLAPRR